MSVTRLYKFVCNLCGDRAENETGAIPEGWLNKVMDHPMGIDHTEKHICDDCVTDICKRSEHNTTKSDAPMLS